MAFFKFSHVNDQMKDYPFPIRKTPGAAGFDIPTWVPFQKKFVIQPGCFLKLPTNISLMMSAGLHAKIAARSKTMEELYVFDGTIDSDYKGEILVGVRNMSSQPVEIKHSESVAQIIFYEIPAVSDLTERSEEEKKVVQQRKGGFGSTDTA